MLRTKRVNPAEVSGVVMGVDHDDTTPPARPVSAHLLRPARGMAGVDASNARAPEVPRVARVAATLFLVGGLGIAAAAAVLLRPTSVDDVVTAPVTTTGAASPSTTTIVATSVAAVTTVSTVPATVPATTGPTIATVPDASPVTTTSAPPRPFGPDGWWRSAVLATTSTGAVEVWTPAGRLVWVDGCSGAPGCAVAEVVLLADAVVVHRYVGFGGGELARVPLDGGAPMVFVAGGGPVGGVTSGLAAAADGGSVFWLTHPPGPTYEGTLHRWPGPDPAIELGSAVLVAPSADGLAMAYARAPRYRDGVATLDAPAEVVVRDLTTGAERSIVLEPDQFPSSLAWTPDGGRLVAQLTDDARVVEVPAAGPLRVARAVPFVATCVDDDQRLLGVRRHGTGASMTHELAEADLRTGKVATWGGSLVEGMLTCRGDGAAVVTGWTSSADGAAAWELRVRRADGRNTLLGRGYVGVSSPRGRSSFSSMQCGGGDGA